ncbi:class I SAM-dependent methyltransferase [Virgibacillus oceani]
MKEYYYDKLLHIKTGQDKKLVYADSFHYNPYEPTPYSALEALSQHYEFTEDDRVIDFGSGKGRLPFYIHHFHQSSVIGVEMDETIFGRALGNLKNYDRYTEEKTHTIEFICCLAEEYIIDPKDNCFYFFNPFSLEIFMKVVGNILRSIEKVERSVDLILYYPNGNYIYHLENNTLFELVKEIKLEDYERNPDERMLFYRLNGSF